MVTVPASGPQAVTPAAGVTENVPVIAVTAAFTVDEICTVLTAPEGTAELSIRLSVLPVRLPVTLVFVPKHGDPWVNARLVPVTLPSAFNCSTTVNASAGVPVVVVKVATQVALMADSVVVGVLVVVPPVGVVGVPVGVSGARPGVVPAAVGVGCIPEVGNGAVGAGLMPGIFGIGLLFTVGVGVVVGVVGAGVEVGVGAAGVEVRLGMADDGELTLPPQPASTSTRASSTADASFTLGLRFCWDCAEIDATTRVRAAGPDSSSGVLLCR